MVNTYCKQRVANFLRGRQAFIFLALIFFSMSGQLFSQQITVRGTVVAEAENETLIGVNILEKNGKALAATDIDGKYSIVCDINSTLVFSYVGYTTREIKVDNQAILDVVLVSDSKLLDALVVTGYRSEIKSNVSSAISTVKGKDVEKLVVLGIDQALQGQAPGIQVTQTSGAPGDDIAVRIRGVGTLGNSNPLYIVDGVPTNANINMFATGDIESIDILKDGAAAAIYGSRAANGVIVITTKKGKSGIPSFNFSSSIGMAKAYRLPKLLNAKDFLDVRNAAIKNANTLRDPARQLDTIPNDVLDTLPDIDWLDQVFRTAPIQKYGLSASGGSENSKYYITGEYLNQDGTYKGQGFKKYSIRFNGETGNKWFKVGNNISYAFTDRQVSNSTGDGFGPGNELSGIRYALIASPVFNPYKPDGSYYNVSSELGDPTLFGDGNANPLALIDATNWTVQRSRIFGNIFAELTLFKAVKIRTNLGGDFTFENEKKFKRKLSEAIYNPTSLNEGRVFSRNLIWTNTADYEKRFGRSRISGVIGMEAIENRDNYLGASVNNFFRTDALFQNIDNSVTTDIKNIGASGITTEWSLLSYFAQVNYSFDNKYVLGATVRRDGSSRFGADNRWGVFPAVSAAWNVSNEEFFKNFEVFSTFKLRASYGILGSQEIGNYPYSSLVGLGQRVYSFGGGVVTGAQLLETGNSQIKWESCTQYDFGLDFSLLNDRLSVFMDYYNKTSNDVLVRVPIPQSGGEQNPPYVNAGSIENKGFELGIIFNNKFRDLNYSVGGNISTVNNKVLSLSDGEPILGGFGLSDGAITKTEVGYPIGSFFLYQADGLFQSQEEIEASAFQTKDTRPGDVKFADLNGDKIIDQNDRTHLGSPFPKFTYGFNLSLNYKNFDLSTLIQGVYGNDVYFLYGNFAYETQSRGFNSYDEIKNYWTPTNTNTDIPKVSLDDRNGNRRVSTRFLQDGSYLKVRNITLGYDFKPMIKTNKIGSLRMYVTGQNLFTFTKYTGLDPEIQANNNDTDGAGITSDFAVGIDWGTVPAPRTFIIGLNLGF
ncbi:MAG: TonB-dependent receptor [Saprospiraceae bacterium]|nr:TonB-dependent receptor [Candidatus Brachybacter algidus]MBK8747667.1 TonB-dependent receptor [Candidatus Brachybacter algidus]